jgi:hypothetical protein
VRVPHDHFITLGRSLGGVSSEFKGDVMEKLFEGRTVFISRGGTGIGQARAIACTTEGAIDTIAGRTESTLKKTIGWIETVGGKLVTQFATLRADKRSKKPSRRPLVTLTGEQRRHRQWQTGMSS